MARRLGAPRHRLRHRARSNCSDRSRSVRRNPAAATPVEGHVCMQQPRNLGARNQAMTDHQQVGFDCDTGDTGRPDWYSIADRPFRCGRTPFDTHRLPAARYDGNRSERALDRVLVPNRYRAPAAADASIMAGPTLTSPMVLRDRQRPQYRPRPPPLSRRPPRQQRPATCDDTTPAWQHALRLDQHGRRRETYYARQCPSWKRYNAFVSARCCDQARSGEDFWPMEPSGIDPKPLGHRPYAPLSEPRCVRSGHAFTQCIAHPQVGIGFARNKARCRRAIDLAAGGNRLIDQRNAKAFTACCCSGGGSSGTRTNDNKIEVLHISAPGKRGSVSAVRPSCTTVMQDWRTLPSISTRHSWHTPIRQNAPRGVPALGLVRNNTTPAAISAAASISPSKASSDRPLKMILAARPRAVPRNRVTA